MKRGKEADGGMTEKPFDPTKPCRTRSGAPARILDINLRTREGTLIVAAIDVGNDEEVAFTFRPDGRYLDDGRTSTNDLVNVPEKHVRWINVFNTNSFHARRSDADIAAKNESRYRIRIARIRIEFEEGQFDE